VLSHAIGIHGRTLPYRVISWIPDFQYLHLPHLFPGLDPQRETQRMCQMVDNCDVLILSSQSALSDLRGIAPAQALTHARVLHFVSQPGWRDRNPDTAPPITALEAKYDFRGRFFLLPNQFWQHKNHQVVFEAVRRLKARGGEVMLLCTGNPRDYRNRGGTPYIDGLREFIRNNDLERNIRILGLIDYDDVLVLMRHCLALLNPSRFEGWSSTVEEGRSLGQRLVLSNIPVHLEQNAPRARYFDPDDPEALAGILGEIWNAPVEQPSAEALHELPADLQRRTIAYGKGYLEIVEALVAGRLADARALRADAVRQ
jgi:glycosyltransferase involved in cell wall biosynthesis